MKNKFLIFLSVIVSLFIIFCFAVIIMVQYPNLKIDVLNFLKNKIENINSDKEYETDAYEPIETLTEPKTPIITFDINNYIDADGNINIEYPILYGIENEEIQNSINKKIFDNATSIIKSYPISTKNQKLSISSTVEYLDEYKIVILYEGIVSAINKKNSAKNNSNYNSNTQSNNNTKKSTSGGGGLYNGSSKYSDNPSNNYQIPGAVYQDNFNFQQQNGITTTPESKYVPQTVSQFDNLPIENPNANIVNPDGSLPIQPAFTNTPPISQGFFGMNDDNNDLIFPLASTLSQSEERIFYTNTIDLTSGFDISLSLYQKSEDISKYMRSSECELVTFFTDDETAIRKFIRNYSQATLVSFLNASDFQNNQLSKWPKCFSYESYGYLYISIQLNKKLGDYAIIRYKIN